MKCPKCGSNQVFRSHRRDLLERFYHWMGAELRRCHECRGRRAWYGSLSFPLADPEARPNRWVGKAAFASGCAASILAAWWIISRLTIPPG